MRSGLPGSSRALVALRFAVLVAVSIAVGIGASLGAAMVGHQVLVFRFGEDGIAAIDDTPLMLALVAGSYLVGVVAGIAVLVFGWRRFIRPNSR